MNLQGRNLLKETDLSAAEFLYLVDLGERLRLQKRMGLREQPAGRPQHRAHLREDVDQDPFGVRGGRARRGRPRHLPGPG